MSFDNLSLQLSQYLNAHRWLIAYSGGVDSHVLLHNLATYLRDLDGSNQPRLVAVHINHQLQSEAKQWAHHCEYQADRLGLEYLPVTVDIHSYGNGSLEDKARKARYQAFESLIQSDDVLMMGHHLDDQVETLMLRMLRGSGTKGTSGMPAKRSIGLGVLFRPLLDTPRSAIEDYARRHQLEWIEDPSNADTDFDRNFLRLKLLPLMAERWPEYRQTLARVALLNRDSSLLNEQLAAQDFESLGCNEHGACLPIDGLNTFSQERQNNVLRYWLSINHVPVPSSAQLHAVLSEVAYAKPDAEPLVEWCDTQVRRFKNNLYVMASLPPFDASISKQWDFQKPLALLSGDTLSAYQTKGRGISVSKLKDQTVDVRFRQGGERCQPATRASAQTLKKLFQEYQLETWQRDRAPLLYCHGELIAVADLWVCKGWQAGETEQGWAVEWQKAR